MIDKDGLVNGYKVLTEKLEEVYQTITIKQYHELETKLAECWQVLERRKK